MLILSSCSSAKIYCGSQRILGSGKQKQIAEHFEHEDYVGFEKKVCKLSEANQQTNAGVLLILSCLKTHINSLNFLSIPSFSHQLAHKFKSGTTNSLFPSRKPARKGMSYVNSDIIFRTNCTVYKFFPFPFLN